jgi:hypothetical protein
MIEDLIAKWAISAIENAPVLVFMGIALWDMRKTLTRCMSSKDALMDRLVDEILEDDPH